MIVFFFLLKEFSNLTICRLQCNAGQFPDALPQLLTLLAGQLLTVKYKFNFALTMFYFPVKRALKIDHIFSK